VDRIPRHAKKSRARKQIPVLPVVVAVLLVLVVAAFILYITDTFGFATSLREIVTANRAEPLDEEGLILIEGDYTIDEPDQRLENTHITGNLYLRPEIGDGAVDLINIRVDGAVLIQGGGSNSIYIVDSLLPLVKVNRTDGRVRMIASGETTIEKTVLESGTRLVENPEPGADGFKKVEITTAEEVELIGSFDSLKIDVEEADVLIESEHLPELAVTRTAAGTVLQLNNGLTVDKLIIDGSTYIIGRIEIDLAYLSAPGPSEMDGLFKKVLINAEAGDFLFKEGSTCTEMIVDKEAYNNSLTFGKDVIVDYLELNEATEVKGEGEIRQVLIKSTGSTFEQIPLSVEFADSEEDLFVTIDGYEISTQEMLDNLIEHGDPDYRNRNRNRIPTGNRI